MGVDSNKLFKENESMRDYSKFYLEPNLRTKIRVYYLKQEPKGCFASFCVKRDKF